MRTLLKLLLFVSLPALAKVQVVATVGDLGALAREVGGEQVSVTVLAPPTQDPHFIDARPNLLVTLSRAQLLVSNGLGLEAGWLPPLLTGSRNPAIAPGAPGHLDASSVVSLLEVPTVKIDRSMGDIHPGGNPHYTKDPLNGVRVARAIAGRLSELDPANAAQYRARADRFEAEAQKKIAEWKARLEPYRGTPVAPYHRSWIYFVSFAGMIEAGYVEPKPGLPPSAAHAASVLQLLRSRQVPAILQEEWYPSGVTEMLAKKSGAALIRVPGMAGAGEGYLDWFERLVSRLEAALGPRPAPRH